MLTYFTELNRKRQAPASLEFVGHTTTPLVHAADDVSVMQTHEALASITASVRAIWPDLAYRLGPVTIGMHRNPYGAHTADNPARQRVAMAPDDPRHQAAFGAAWLVGYAAAVQHAGIEVLSLLHAHGVSGPTLREHMPDWEPGACVPAWRVLHQLLRASGYALHSLSGLPDQLAGLAWVTRQWNPAHVAGQPGAEPVRASLDGALDGQRPEHSLARRRRLTAPAHPMTMASSTLHFSAYQVLVADPVTSNLCHFFLPQLV